MLDTVTSFGASTLGPVWPVVWTVIKIVAVVLPLMIFVAYLTLWERKLLGCLTDISAIAQDATGRR